MQDSKLGGRIGQRYAEALLSLGKEQNLLERFGQDLSLVEEVLVREPQLQALLGSPVIAIQVKKDLLSRAFAQDIHPFTLNFCQILTDRRRSMFLLDVCQAFQKLLRGLQKTTIAEVISAVLLTDEQKDQLQQRLLALTKAERVELKCQLDPELLGGMIVRFGDDVIDASLRGQLRQLALQLSAS